MAGESPLRECELPELMSGNESEDEASCLDFNSQGLRTEKKQLTPVSACLSATMTASASSSLCWSSSSTCSLSSSSLSSSVSLTSSFSPPSSLPVCASAEEALVSSTTGNNSEPEPRPRSLSSLGDAPSLSLALPLSRPSPTDLTHADESQALSKPAEQDAISEADGSRTVKTNDARRAPLPNDWFQQEEKKGDSVRQSDEETKTLITYFDNRCADFVEKNWRQLIWDINLEIGEEPVLAEESVLLVPLLVLRCAARCEVREDLATSDAMCLTTRRPDRYEAWALRGRAFYVANPNEARRSYRQANRLAQRALGRKPYALHVKQCTQAIRQGTRYEDIEDTLKHDESREYMRTATLDFFLDEREFLLEQPSASADPIAHKAEAAGNEKKEVAADVSSTCDRLSSPQRPSASGKWQKGPTEVPALVAASSDSEDSHSVSPSEDDDGEKKQEDDQQGDDGDDGEGEEEEEEADHGEKWERKTRDEESKRPPTSLPNWINAEELASWTDGEEDDKPDKAQTTKDSRAPPTGPQAQKEDDDDDDNEEYNDEEKRMFAIKSETSGSLLGASEIRERETELLDLKRRQRALFAVFRAETRRLQRRTRGARRAAKRDVPVRANAGDDDAFNILTPAHSQMARDRERERLDAQRRREEIDGVRTLGNCGGDPCQRERLRKAVTDDALYYHVRCTAGCVIFYHPKCWAASKTCLDTELCPTPNCEGRLSLVEHWHKDDVRSKHRVYFPLQIPAPPTAPEPQVTAALIAAEKPADPGPAQTTASEAVSAATAIASPRVGPRTRRRKRNRKRSELSWRELDKLQTRDAARERVATEHLHRILSERRQMRPGELSQLEQWIESRSASRRRAPQEGCPTSSLDQHPMHGSQHPLLSLHSLSSSCFESATLPDPAPPASCEKAEKGLSEPPSGVGVGSPCNQKGEGSAPSNLPRRMSLGSAGVSRFAFARSPSPCESLCSSASRATLSSSSSSLSSSSPLSSFQLSSPPAPSAALATLFQDAFSELLDVSTERPPPPRETAPLMQPRNGQGNSLTNCSQLSSAFSFFDLSLA